MGEYSEYGYEGTQPHNDGEFIERYLSSNYTHNDPSTNKITNFYDFSMSTYNKKLVSIDISMNMAGAKIIWGVENYMNFRIFEQKFPDAAFDDIANVSSHLYVKDFFQEILDDSTVAYHTDIIFPNKTYMIFYQDITSNNYDFSVGWADTFNIIKFLGWSNYVFQNEIYNKMLGVGYYRIPPPLGYEAPMLSINLFRVGENEFRSIEIWFDDGEKAAMMTRYANNSGAPYKWFYESLQEESDASNTDISCGWYMKSVDASMTVSQAKCYWGLRDVKTQIFSIDISNTAVSDATGISGDVTYTLIPDSSTYNYFEQQIFPNDAYWVYKFDASYVDLSTGVLNTTEFSANWV